MQVLEEVKDIAGMKKIANEILQTADTDSHTLEHHGIKGQRWGRRRTPAELGYRQAMRQKRKEEKLAARKEKYMRDPKQVYKHKNLFSQEEINRALSRAQQEQRLYETSHAQQIQKAKERQAAKAERDAKRQAKAAERAQIKDEKRQERMHKLEEKTKLDIEKSRGKAQVEMQKQRDKAQAEREQANREYQTQQQIKKGKTLTARLAKLGALLKNVSVVAEQGQKLAADMGITAHYDSKKSLLSGMFGKLNWSKDDIDAFNRGMSGQEYKDWKEEQKRRKDTKDSQNEPPKNEPSKNEPSKNEPSKNEPRFNMDTSGWDTSGNTQWSSSKDQGNKSEKNSSSINTSGWNPNTNQKWSISDNKNELQKAKAESKSNLTEKKDKNLQKENTLKTKTGGLVDNNKAKQAPEESHKKQKKERKQNEQKAAQEKAKAQQEEVRRAEQEREASEKARQIKENAQRVKQNAQGPLSDTAKFILSLPTPQLADILATPVPGTSRSSLTPDKINFGSFLSSNKNGPTSYGEEFNKSEKMLRKTRKGHSKEGRWSEEIDAGDEYNAEQHGGTEILC